MKLKAFSFKSLFFVLFIAMFIFTAYMMFSHITELQNRTNNMDKGLQPSNSETIGDGITESNQSIKESPFRDKLPGMSEPVMLPVLKDPQVVDLKPEGSDHVVSSPRPSVSPLATQTSGDLDEEQSPADLDEPTKEFCYSIQFGSFKNLSNAKARVGRLTDKGVPAWWEKANITGKGERYRVLIGKQKSRAEALSLAEKLKATGIIDVFYVKKLCPTD